MTLHKIYKLHKSGLWPMFWSDQYVKGGRSPDRTPFTCLKKYALYIQTLRETVGAIIACLAIEASALSGLLPDSLSVTLIALVVILVMIFFIIIPGFDVLESHRLSKKELVLIRSYQKDIQKMDVAIGIQHKDLLLAKDYVNIYLLSQKAEYLALTRATNRLEQSILFLDPDIQKVEAGDVQFPKLAEAFGIVDTSTESMDRYEKMAADIVRPAPLRSLDRAV